MNFKERQEIIAKSPISFAYLRKFNFGAGILQLINGVAILALTFTLTWPKGTDIYTFYLSFSHVSPTNPAFFASPNPQILFTVSHLGLLLAAFPLISAFAHFVIAFPRNKVYNENLKNRYESIPMVRIRFFQFNHDLDYRDFRWNLGFLVSCNDICLERDDDNVRLYDGTRQPKNRKNKLVSLHLRQHIRWFSMGSTLCLLHW